MRFVEILIKGHYHGARFQHYECYNLEQWGDEWMVSGLFRPMAIDKHLSLSFSPPAYEKLIYCFIDGMLLDMS